MINNPDYQLPIAVKKLLARVRQEKLKLVLVTGVFDILHQEHYLFLEQAAKEGEVLLVGLESDERVRQLKGARRPLNPENVRQENLEKLAVADEVFILPEHFSREIEHEALLRLIKPAVLAVSSHTPFLEQKKNLMHKIGGQLRIVHEHNPEISSSKLIKSPLTS